MSEIINTGFKVERFPGTIAFGVTFNRDVYKTNYEYEAPNCVRYWFCINMLCWQFSYSGVSKVYGIKR